MSDPHRPAPGAARAPRAGAGRPHRPSALEELAALARRVLAAAPTAALLEDVAHTAARVLGAERAEVLAPREGALVRLAGAGWDEPADGPPATLPSHDAAGRAWWTDGVRIVDDLRDVPALRDAYAGSAASAALCPVPGLGADPAGLLAAYGPRPAQFGSEDAHALQAVAALLASVLRRHDVEADRDRVRAGAEVAHRDAARAVARTTQLQAVTAALVPPLAPAEVARVIVEQGVAALGAQAGVLAMRTAADDALEIGYAVGYARAVLAPWERVPLADCTPLGVATLTGAPVVVSSIAERDARFPMLAAAAATFPASVTVPLPLEDRTLGALGLSFADERAIAVQDTAFLLALGRLCAQALQRARAFETEQVARASAEAAAERTAQLQSVTAALSQALTTAAITRIVIDSGATALHAEAGNMALLDAAGTTLVANHAVNVPDDVLARWRDVPLDAADPMAESVRTRRIVSYATAAERVARWGGPAPRLQSAAFVPIHAGERALGGWSLAFHAPRTFTDDEQRFLLALGHQAALALERARLYEAERSARLEREALLAVVQEERGRLARALSQFPGAAAVFEGPDLVFRAVSAAYQAGLGGRPLLGRPAREALPDVDATYLALLEQAYATGQPVAGTGARARWDDDGDGVREDHVIDFVYQPLVRPSADPAARVVEGVLAFVQDQTARHAAEAALRERETGLRLAVDIAALGMWTWDPETDLAVADARARDLFGFAPHEPITREAVVHTRVHPDDRARVTAAIAGAVDPAGDGSFAIEYRVVRPDGSERWASALGRVEFALEGAVRRPLRMLGTVMDRTDPRRAEAERERALAESERARADADRANRAKSDFLAVMSHELRTPLNAIGGYAELIEMEIHGPVTEAQRVDLTRIQRSQRHLLGLINELLTFARLESGTLRYEIVDVRAADVIASVEGVIVPQVRARALTLDVRAEPAGLTVRADAERLRQVLLNLLSNAVKFTEPGGRVTLRCEPRGPHVAFAVHDTGIGIPADQLERIFEPFVQVRGGLTRPHDGTGLGLSISRELARAMGGDLRAESAVGAGSTFTLSLPLASVPR